MTYTKTTQTIPRSEHGRSIEDTQMRLPGWGKDDAMLCSTRVLLAGAGGIGFHLAETLVRYGVGEVHIVDPDIVDRSNLNRAFRPEDEGRPKVEVLVDTLCDLGWRGTRLPPTSPGSISGIGPPVATRGGCAPGRSQTMLG